MDLLCSTYPAQPASPSGHPSSVFLAASYSVQAWQAIIEPPPPSRLHPCLSFNPRRGLVGPYLGRDRARICPLQSTAASAWIHQLPLGACLPCGCPAALFFLIKQRRSSLLPCPPFPSPRFLLLVLFLVASTSLVVRPIHKKIHLVIFLRFASSLRFCKDKRWPELPPPWTGNSNLSQASSSSSATCLCRITISVDFC